MRIALAQIDCRLGNLPANLETHRRAMAGAGDADLIVFPELSLTGYRLRSNIHRVMLDDGELTASWEQLRTAISPSTHVALGYVEVTEAAVLHNSTAVLRGDELRPVLRHRKVYLPTYGMFEEARYARPGNHFHATTLETAGSERWRVGVLCCEDAWHSSAWAILQARRVDLILVPSASPGRGVEADRLGSQQSWYGILSTHAELCGCWVAYCNRVGFEDDIHFWGGSALFSPHGELVAEAPLMESDVLTCELDKRAIASARIATPLLADERWELTIRELQEARADSLGEENRRWTDDRC